MNSRMGPLTQTASRALGSGLTWLGIPAGDLSSLSESSSLLSHVSVPTLLASTAGVLSWSRKVTLPNLVGPGAVFAGDSLAGAEEALVWAGFTEGFT